MFVFIRNFELHVGNDVVTDIQHRLYRHLNVSLCSGTDQLIGKKLLKGVRSPDRFECSNALAEDLALQ